MANLYVSKLDYSLMVDKKDLRKALRQAGNYVKNEARQLILAPKSGVSRSNSSGWSRSTGQRHVASAPGEAPASLTGLLASSMKVTLRGDTVMVTDKAWYAVALEAGVHGGGRGKGGKSGASKRSWGLVNGKMDNIRKATTDREIEPRPYLSTALAQTDVQGILQSSVEKIITNRTTFKW